MKLIFIYFFPAIILMSNTSTYNPIQYQSITLKESIKRGNEIYTDFCMQCHLTNGEGVKNIFPPLANSDYLIKYKEASIRSIKFGLQGEITVNDIKYNGIMTNLGLSNDEIADVMNYITNSWGNKNDKIITKKEVAKIKK